MNDAPFKRDELLDKPGIVGARWWHEGLAHQSPVTRRLALQALMVGGGIFAFGALVSKASSCSQSGTTSATRNALATQKEFGWNFGGTSTLLTFDGAQAIPFQAAATEHLATDLAPAQLSLRPYFIPTLLQSPQATPKTIIPNAPVAFTPLATSLKPYLTDSMGLAYRQGRALASLFDPSIQDVAIIVDLPGHDSVAFAAGAAQRFDPVFAIDNWPHSLGVVPAHLTLGATMYYQPLFAKTALSRVAPSPPLFVLDRRRLTPLDGMYVQFDNRHLARLPSADQWKALGIKHILYVAPSDTNVPELDDLNDDFVTDSGGGIDVKIVGANAFGPDATVAPPNPSDPDGPPFYYGRMASSHEAFWVDYPWVTPPRAGVHPNTVSLAGVIYAPARRATPFHGSVGALSPMTRTPPSGFGTVEVEIAATGVVLGALLTQSSWNRSSGGGGWGG